MTTYDRNVYLYVITTRNCNYACDHCHISAGPGQKHRTMSVESFRRLVAHLPKKRRTKITLTGGEVFTQKSILYGYLDAIKEENVLRRSRRQSPIEPLVQTNGFWMTSERRTRRTLQELTERDVKRLDIPSKDKYHEKEGADLRHLARMVAYARFNSLIGEISFRGTNVALPVGRARKRAWTRRWVIPLYEDKCRSALHDHDLDVDFDGQVHACCFLRMPIGGSIIEEPLLDIIRRARKDPWQQTLHKKGIRGVASTNGRRKATIERDIRRYGPCGMCAKRYPHEHGPKGHQETATTDIERS
jgi:hypothetical protein